MRVFNWISRLLTACLILCMLPCALAEENILSAPVDKAVSEVVSFDLGTLYAEEDHILQGDETESEAPALAVEAATDGDFVIDENGTLTKYNGFDKDVVIPEGVTKIDDSAFRGISDIESVAIPSSVTSIGWYAFSGCSSLQSITIPEGVTIIECGAFSGCSSMQSVTIPNSVTYIDWDAFEECSSLKSVTIPNSVTTIGFRAFYGCTSLKSVTISGSVTKIEDSTFSMCSSLQNVIIPDSVTSIEACAFYDCANLNCVTVPNSVTFIEKNAFEYCSNVVFCGNAGFYAEQFAHDVGIPFNAPIVSFDEDNYNCDDNGDKKSIVYINQSRTFKVSQSPSILTTMLVWFSSNPNIARVDQSGTVTGVSEGTVTITAATANGKGRAAQIPVVVPGPSGISINYGYNAYLNPSEPANVNITVDPEYASLLTSEVELPVTYTISDETVLSLGSVTIVSKNNYTLKLTALKPGTTTLTVTSSDGGKASISVEVIRPRASGINIDQTGPIQLEFGDTYTLSATVTPTEADHAVIWYSWDTCIATIEKNGIIKATGTGETTIQAETTDHIVRDSIIVKVQGRSLNNHHMALLPVKDQTYTGKALEPTVMVKLDGKALKKDTDYTVSYKNNTKAGKATVTVTGKGNYTGSVETSFTIKPVSIKGAKVTLNKTAYTYTGKAFKPTVTVKLDGKTLRKGTDYTVSYKNNTKPGKATVTVTGKGNYTGSAETNFTIKPISIKGAKVTLNKTTYTYTGKAFKPTVTVDLNGKTLKKGTDYTVSYKNNTKPGKATVTVKGKGNYTGGVSTTFAVNPKKVAGLKLKAGKQQITVSWTKDGTVSGYEVQYGLKKTESGSQVVTVKKIASKKAIKKLTANKTYYVRIRSFKKVGSAKYYSQWSAYKKIKVK